MSAVLKIAATSPGNERYPFALGLDDLAVPTAVSRRFASLGDLRETEIVSTPQVMLEVFSPEECRRIVARCEAQPLHQGQVAQERENYRRANAAWILSSSTPTNCSVCC